MARKPTCPKCHKFIEKNENVKTYKNKKYHVSCYKQIVQEIYQTKNTQQDDKQELYKYICELFNIKELTPMIKAQIEKYYTENEFTYNGMYYTLKYFFEILENDTSNCEGIGIVPYMYEEAKEFYLLKNKLGEKEFKIDNCVIPKTVKVKEQKEQNPYLIRMEEL